jgi:hypothetical protein
LIAMIASHFSAGKSGIAATCWMPALLTRMSQAPACFDQGAAFVALRHVGLDVARRHTRLLRDFGGERVVLVPVGEGVQDDIRAGLRQLLRDAQPDAGVRSR